MKKKSDVNHPNSLQKVLLGTSSATLPAESRPAGSNAFWAKCVRSVTLMAALNAQMAPVYAGKVELYHADTIAGDGTRGYSGDLGLATSASLNNPGGVAVNGTGNVYIADTKNQRIRFVPAADGTYYGQSCKANDIYTIAGNGIAGNGNNGNSETVYQSHIYSGDGGLAILAPLFNPEHIATDHLNNVYIADCDNFRTCFVPAVDGTYFGQSCTAGHIYTIHSDFSGQTSGVAVDGTGNVYFDNNRTHFIPVKDGTYFGQSCTANGIYTIAGDGAGGYAGDGGSALYAKFKNPAGMAVDGAGNLYIADRYGPHIRFVAGSDGTYFGQSCTAGNIYTIAGNGSLSYIPSDGPVTSVSFAFPLGVAIDGARNMYIGDCSDGISYVPATSFGSASASYVYYLKKDIGIADVAVDNFGNVYCVYQSSNTVQKLSPNYIAEGASDTATTNTDYGLFETINLAGGTLIAGASGSGSGLTISNPIYLTPNTTSILDTTLFPLTLTGAITGTGFLTQIGSNSLSITGNFNPISIGGSNVVLSGSSLTLSAPIVVDTHDTRIDLSSCVITGSYPIAVISSGTVNFPANYSGTVTYANDGTQIQCGSNTDTCTSTIDQQPAYVDQVSSAGYLTIGYSGTSNPDSSTPLSSGSLIMTGSGQTLTLTNTNTYPGPTLIEAGTLQISGSIDSSSNIVNNASLVFNQTADDTYAGVISGSGNLVQSGSSILTLAGSNTYTGATTISSGTLQITGSIDSSSNIVNNAKLIFAQSDDDTYAGNISGSGSLTQSSLGYTLTLSGSNTYTGPTTINLSSYLTITGSINANATIINNGNLYFNQTNDFNYTGALSGSSGSLQKQGSNTLTLTGSNSYAGEIDLSSGTLNLANANAVSSASSINLHGGRLQAGINLNLSNSIAVWSQSGSTLDAGSNTFTLSGLISDGMGTSLLTIANSSSGTVVLAGSNTYSSGTILTAGTLKISDSSNIGTGALTLAGGTLQAGADLTLNQALILSADSILDPNGHNVTLQGLITPNGHTLTILSGSATYSPGGSGSYTLTGSASFNPVLSSASLSYDGLTAESSASVSLSPATNLFGTSATYGIVSGMPSGLSLASATGIISGTPAPSSTGTSNLIYTVSDSYGSSTGSATLTINAPTIYLSGETISTEYGSATSQFTPNTSGGLSPYTYREGTPPSHGSLTINNTDNYFVYTPTSDYSGDDSFSLVATDSGGFVSDPATYNLLVLSNGTNITSSGGLTTLTFNPTELTQVFSGTITGTNAVVLEGSNTLTLAGSNTYTGPTTISSGTLQITGSIDSSSNIVNNAGLVFNQSTDDTYAGVISGSGVLVQSGSNILTLAGSNTYTSGTILTAGTLSISEPSNIGTGALTLAGGTLALSADVVLNQDLAIAAPSTININGNTLTLVGSISGSATLTISGGSAGGGFVSFSNGLSSFAPSAPSLNFGDSNLGDSNSTHSNSGAHLLSLGEPSIASSDLGASFLILGSGVRLLGDLPSNLFLTVAETHVDEGVGTINELSLALTAIDHKTGSGTLAITSDNSSASFGVMAVDGGALMLNNPKALGSGGLGNILVLADGTTLQCGSSLSTDASSPSLLPQAIYYSTSATVNTSDGSSSHALETTNVIMSTSSASAILNVTGGGTFIPSGPYVGNGSDSFVVSDSGTRLIVPSSASVPPTVALTDATAVTIEDGVVVTKLVVVSDEPV